MKLILSRKGFDSEFGGCASPIFPDGTMFSLPIPDDGSRIAYDDLRHKGVNVGSVVEGITRGRISGSAGAGLDPDVNADVIRRPKGWRPIFGQASGAESHLRDPWKTGYPGDGVGDGDIFLFFGSFKRVESDNGWHFVRGARELHVLWGWLQVGAMHDVRDLTMNDLKWAREYHPHLDPDWDPDPNRLYITRDALRIGNRFKAPGAGVFKQFHDRLVLTESGMSKSNWRLESFFFPDEEKPLSWQGGDKNWQAGGWGRDDNYAYLKSTDKGQEFVLDCDHYPEAIPWARDLIRDLGAR